MKRLLRSLLIISVLAFSANVRAKDPIYTGFFSNNAIKGYDTVAYFTQNQDVEGSDEFSFEYKGANWLFSSKENLELFKADPEKYAPQYGGYCAYAVSQGGTASVQPDLFTIHKGKLYLNYNESINDKWAKDKDAYIEAADKHWPTVLEQ